MNVMSDYDCIKDKCKILKAFFLGLSKSRRGSHTDMK